MFGRKSKMLKEIKGLLEEQRSRFSRIPAIVKTETAEVRKKKKSRFAALAAIGAGVLAAIAAIGAAKAVREKLIKKVVVLVGEGNKPSGAISGCRFRGYLVKYTTLDDLDFMINELIQDGFEEVIFVPMTVLNGYEAEKIRTIAAYKGEAFKSIKFAPALMSSDSDYDYIASTLIACTRGADEDTAIVYVGQGTTHFSNASYIALAERLKYYGSDNIFIGTLTGYPGFDKVRAEIEDGHYQKVVLCPLEITVTDGFMDELAGDNEDSWVSRLADEGFDCHVYEKGLCAYKGIRSLIVEHTKRKM